MNKKSLAKKIFNFKKNKKKITEGWASSDEVLGHIQSGLSTISAAASIIPGMKPGVGLVSGGLAWVVNRTRQELDANGVVPSKSGNLATQGKLISTGLGAQVAGTASGKQAINALPFGIGGVLSLATNHPKMTKFGGAGSMIASTEWAREVADPVTDALGIPNIPGISKRLTDKPELGKVRNIDVARDSNTLALIAATHQRR